MKADFTIFFSLVFAVAAFVRWDWPNIAKIMPVYIAAIPGLVSCNFTGKLREAPRRRLWWHGSI
jgi:hypothetical protein